MKAPLLGFRFGVRSVPDLPRQFKVKPGGALEAMQKGTRWLRKLGFRVLGCLGCLGLKVCALLTQFDSCFMGV